MNKQGVSNAKVSEPRMSTLKEDGGQSFLHQVQNCYEGVVEYMDAWKKFDGAGTHLLDSLQTGLRDSGYERLGQETSKAFNVSGNCWTVETNKMNNAFIKYYMYGN